MSSAKLAMYGLMISAGLFVAVLEYFQVQADKKPKQHKGKKPRRYREKPKG